MKESYHKIYCLSTVDLKVDFHSLKCYTLQKQQAGGDMDVYYAIYKNYDFVAFVNFVSELKKNNKIGGFIWS